MKYFIFFVLDERSWVRQNFRTTKKGVLVLKCFKLLILFFTVTSCANVKHIDQGLSQSRLMQLDPIPEENVFLEEVNSYREGAAGGSASVGGGCGCN